MNPDGWLPTMTASRHLSVPKIRKVGLGTAMKEFQRLGPSSLLVILNTKQTDAVKRLIQALTGSQYNDQ